MQRPLISVVIPVYNSAKYLSDALESIRCQDFKDFEVLIFDGGSTDGSVEIASAFAKLDNRFQVLSRAGQSLIEALNEGIELAAGQFLARMDADDFSTPNRLGRQLELMEKEALDFCSSHFAVVDSANRVQKFKLVPTRFDRFTAHLCNGVPFAHPCVMVRRSFLLEKQLKYGGGPCTCVEDYDLWVRAFFSGAKFGNVDDCLFRYRVHESSISKSKASKIAKENLFLNAFVFKTGIERLKQEIRKCSASADSITEIDELNLASAAFRLLLIGEFEFSKLVCKRIGVTKFLFWSFWRLALTLRWKVSVSFSS